MKKGAVKVSLSFTVPFFGGVGINHLCDKMVTHSRQISAGAFGHDGGDFGSCVFAEEAGDLFREPCGEVSDEYAGEDVGGIVDAEVKSREGDERGENEHNNAEFLRQVMVEDESSSEGR